jgi:hypothetical protein
MHPYRFTIFPATNSAWLISTNDGTPRTILNSGFGTTNGASTLTQGRLLQFPRTPTIALVSSGGAGTRRLVATISYHDMFDNVYVETWDTGNVTTISTAYHLPTNHCCNGLVDFLRIETGTSLQASDLIQLGPGVPAAWNATPNFGLLQQIKHGVPWTPRRPPRQERYTVPITSSTNATPIVLTVPSGHGVFTGDQIIIQNHLVNTNANGSYIAKATSGTTITLGQPKFPYADVVGNGVGGATGEVVVARGGMLDFDSGAILVNFGSHLDDPAAGSLVGGLGSGFAIRWDAAENAVVFIDPASAPLPQTLQSNIVDLAFRA